MGSSPTNRPNIAVMWDLENCGVPHECIIGDIPRHIYSAIRKKNATVSFFAYAKMNTIPWEVKNQLSNAAVNLVDVRSSRKNAVDFDIMNAMYEFVIRNYTTECKLFLITGDQDFAGTLYTLKRLRHPVYLSCPIQTSRRLFNAAEKVWYWPQLARGQYLDPVTSFRELESLAVSKRKNMWNATESLPRKDWENDPDLQRYVGSDGPDDTYVSGHENNQSGSLTAANDYIERNGGEKAADEDYRRTPGNDTNQKRKSKRNSSISSHRGVHVNSEELFDASATSKQLGYITIRRDNSEKNGWKENVDQRPKRRRENDSQWKSQSKRTRSRSRSRSRSRHRGTRN